MFLVIHVAQFPWPIAFTQLPSCTHPRPVRILRGFYGILEPASVA